MKAKQTISNWFFAQLKPNSHDIAQRNLERQGFETFLPLEDKFVWRLGRYVAAPRPLFPGYIFVGFDIAESAWRAVNSTYGITRLVSFGELPAEIPSEIVSLLKQRCDSGGVLLPSKDFQPGDNVTIVNGPFESFVAEVEKVEPERRVWVLMDLMGGRTRIEISPDQLRAN